MLFTVTINTDGTPYWTCLVEAEDQDGAIREAMTELRASRGRTLGPKRKHALTTEVVVEAVSRDLARQNINNLLN